MHTYKVTVVNIATQHIAAGMTTITHKSDGDIAQVTHVLSLAYAKHAHVSSVTIEQLS